jgi:aminoglycoside phosphotransferase (APT) family kinase protein
VSATATTPPPAARAAGGGGGPLAQQDVVPYLLHSGLISPAAVVDGPLVVHDRSSRNRNYAVKAETGPSLLLKQGIGAAGAHAVAREATVYGRLAAEPALRALVPRPYGYDSRRGILVLELVTDAPDLRSYHHQRRRFPATPGRLLGRALGTLHRVTRSGHDEPQPDWAPTPLLIHRPDLSVMRDASAASLELIKLIQHAPGLPESIDELRATWRPEALVHLDLKWDNCLLARHPRSGRATVLKLIDWESGSLGDPCWDLGAAFSQYLSAWVFSIPVTGAVPPERFPELATHPLEEMHAALRACWTAYRRALGADDDARRLVQSVRYAAVRLLQTALEAAQMADQLTGPVVLHVQLAANMLERPEEAAVHLLGLPLQAFRP